MPKGLKGFFIGFKGGIGLAFFIRFPEIHTKKFCPHSEFIAEA
jgi:hypothetical protein